jgi:diguanylate cyclase (GGDEF)-like protein
LLFLVAGVLGMLAAAAPGADQPISAIVINGVAVLCGVVSGLLPWHRWSPRATLVLALLAFALIDVGQLVNSDGVTTVYGVWFVVVFAWVGTWHPQRTALMLGPVGAVAYVVPFLPGAPAASTESLLTVIVGLPIAVVLGEVFAAKAAAMSRAQSDLQEAAVLLERANLTDDLTGLGNRRRANSMLDGLQPGDGLVLFDLDHFKAVNDEFGHAEGDRILSLLGEYLAAAVRDADTVARFGGEEFLLVVRSAGEHVGATVDRLLGGWRSVGAGVTLSAGAAVHVAGKSPSDTLKLVDTLLYRAKDAGRNRFVLDVG